jgi:exosome complex exonuclease DIS3/RRP44
VEVLGKTMDDFQQRLDSLLSQGSAESSSNVQLPHQLRELRQDFVLFKKEATDSMASIKKDINSIKVQLRDTSKEVDELSQYSRRNCILIHGIPETPNENTETVALKVINENLKLRNINLALIDRCHRIGAPKRNTAEVLRQGKRAIIVKFTSYRSRNEVWRAKRLLKNSNILITESLTQTRQKLLKMAKDRFGLKQVWTQDGRIVVLLNGRRFTVTCEEDLRDIS